MRLCDGVAPVLLHWLCPMALVFRKHLQHVDEAACTERGVLVGNTPGVLTDATAEMAVALLLAHARRIVEGDKRARDPALRKIDSGWFGKQVSGSMVGIVGLGRIGEAIAKRCVALGASVCYHKRSRAPVEVEAALGGAQFHASLDGLLGCCNFVVLCCPFSAATAQLISAPQLKRLLPGAVLVNIGRGGLVDQLAVAAALESGALGGYATDVTDPEPLPVGHPLLAAPRTTITPHTGSATLQTRTAMLNLALDNIAAAIAGTPMPACPNARDIAARKPESH